MMEFARQGAEYLENGGDIEEFSKNPGKFTKGGCCGRTAR